jgi:demethylmenaquinone methyltransferase/2-methoxy-6-polyprenyl-1,4-benzoquinol methylase
VSTRPSSRWRTKLAEDKRAFVRELFVNVGPRYDLINRVTSAGMDLSWRRYALSQTALPPGGLLLDAATGTGDVALEALSQMPGARVVGVDFTPEMLHLGRAKAAERRLHSANSLHWSGGDALRLPFPADTFDAAISAFLLRNVMDIRQAFAEQRRVVKPGGRVVCLEIARPGLPIFRTLFRLYFSYFVPVLGGLISGHRYAYDYLPDSLARLPSPAEIRATMEEVGLREVRYKPLNLGTVSVHVGVK